MTVNVQAASWWHEAPAVTISRQSGYSRSYRFGEAILDVDGTYSPLLDELESAYADCTTRDDAEVRIGCSVHSAGGSLVALRFTGASLPNLTDVAFSLIRPRVENARFQVMELDRPGWRLIGNTEDALSPLMAADTSNAVIDTRLEPEEFLVNFVVAVAQAAQTSMIFLHAGGVSINGRGTLLIGRSGKGKSTTTVTLGGRGHALLGDETVAIRPETGDLFPFPRTLKLRPGPRGAAVIDRLSKIPVGTRIDAGGVECAWVTPTLLFPRTPISPSVPLGNVFFLREFGSRAAAESFVPSLANLDELQALTMSLSAIASWPSVAAQRLMRFIRLIEVFSKRRCYFLTLGTPDETAALIERTVERDAECS